MNMESHYGAGHPYNDGNKAFDHNMCLYWIFQYAVSGNKIEEYSSIRGLSHQIMEIEIVSISATESRFYIL